MKLRKFLICLAVLSFLFAAIQLAVAPPAVASGLVVEVTTDKAEYDPDEVVIITVRVTLDGQPLPANIDHAYIDVSYASGYTYRNYITWDFVQVSPGLFIANGRAGRAGMRHVHVAAWATIKEGCCCRVVCGSGSAAYAVRQVCQPCCSCCQPCCPCYQPRYPCVECRAPDFFIKHFISRPDIGEERRVFLKIPDHVMAQLLQLANPVAFREASPHSVIWSDIPGLGWTNDPLADLGLSLNPDTGRITGDLSFAYVVKDNYFFFIEALNPTGEVIAGIWIEIAFV
jgi:hypothetical protein